MQACQVVELNCRVVTIKSLIGRGWPAMMNGAGGWGFPLVFWLVNVVSCGGLISGVYLFCVVTGGGPDAGGFLSGDRSAIFPFLFRFVG